MGMTAADYLAQLQALLPPGPAWSHDSEAVITHLLAGWSAEYARVDGRSASLMGEADPRSTWEMLTDWERCLGLPDSCTGSMTTNAERIDAVVARLTGIGGQAPAFYIALAASLGYSITITEFHPHTVGDDVDYPLYSIDWAHAWQVNTLLNTVRELTVDDDVDMPLAIWGNQLLECAIRRVRPAHSIVLFAYS